MLYLALSPARSQLKIGYTRDSATLRARLRALHCVLIDHYALGDRADEAAVQRHLAHEALPDGEWFEISFDTLAFIGDFGANAERAIAVAAAYPRARLPRHRANAVRTARITAATR